MNETRIINVIVPLKKIVNENSCCMAAAMQLLFSLRLLSLGNTCHYKQVSYFSWSAVLSACITRYWLLPGRQTLAMLKQL